MASEKIFPVEPVETYIARQIAGTLPTNRRFSGLGIVVPPNQWAGTNRNEHYWIFIRQIGEIIKIAGTRLTITVSLHPRAEAHSSEIAGILNYPAHSFEDVARVLAHSRVLLQCGSATMRFATELGICLIDWDLFGYQTAQKLLEGFSEGVWHVNSVDNVLEAITEALDRPGPIDEKADREWSGIEAIINWATEA